MKKMLAMLFITIGNIPLAFAGTKAHKDSDSLFIMVGLILLPLVLYTANKWRRWKFGYDCGRATASDFFTALKWSFGTILITGTSFLVLSKFG